MVSARPTPARPAPARQHPPAGAGGDARRTTDPRQVEPRGIGTATARDPLAREVKLLGALLGQVILEQEGLELFERVERVRRRAIALRRDSDRPDAEELLAREFEGLRVAELDVLARAFTCYFLLANLCEEKHRVRTIRQRARAAGGVVDTSIAAAIEELAERGASPADVRALADRLELRPVLTAHPTEARRRTILLALRRLYALIDRLDDARLTPREDVELRRSLREEITVLWQTDLVRGARPTPLDEVRTAMAFFDETIFRVTPQLYRVLDAALARLDPDVTGDGERELAPPLAGPFIHWGSWIGGDRDGHPAVTAEVTRETLHIHADHLLRGYERVCARLMTTLAISVHQADVPADYLALVEAEADRVPEVRARLEGRFPESPYRRAFGYLGERIRRTRLRLTSAPGPAAATEGAYGSAAELVDHLRRMQDALVAHGAARAAYGAVQDFRAQVETFGFHLASLEIRQHSEVLAAAWRVAADGGDLAAELPNGGISTAEVLASFRVMAELQERFGPDACRRCVISFTRSVEDVRTVLRLAGHASVDPDAVDAGPTTHPFALDIVPLFESSDALAAAGPLLRDLLADPAYRAHLAGRGDSQEVMLGYSDSNKELGFLAAGWAIHRAQEGLVAAARDAGVELTLFHGRGGAIARGGGPATRAILAQASGSVEGRLKLTEQGEVIAARYANVEIAERELEQFVHAILLASREERSRDVASAAERWRDLMEELSELALAAYGALVWERPGFERFFHQATPVAEIADMYLGSRPAGRGRKEGERAPPLRSIRAIPWVFAWTQNRINLPGWYGVGTALETYRARHGEHGLERLRAAHREWPFFAALLEAAEHSLARADLLVGRAHAELAATGTSAPAEEWLLIEAEFARSVREVLSVTGRDSLLESAPRLRRSIELRNPYVDSLSEIQLSLLRRLRGRRLDPAERADLRRVVQLTVSGISAGLQSTG